MKACALWMLALIGAGAYSPAPRVQAEDSGLELRAVDNKSEAQSLAEMKYQQILSSSQNAEAKRADLIDLWRGLSTWQQQHLWGSDRIWIEALIPERTLAMSSLIELEMRHVGGLFEVCPVTRPQYADFHSRMPGGSLGSIRDTAYVGLLEPVLLRSLAHKLKDSILERNVELLDKLEALSVCELKTDSLMMLKKVQTHQIMREFFGEDWLRNDPGKTPWTWSGRGVHLRGGFVQDQRWGNEGSWLKSKPGFGLDLDYGWAWGGLGLGISIQPSQLKQDTWVHGHDLIKNSEMAHIDLTTGYFYPWQLGPKTVVKGFAAYGLQILNLKEHPEPKVKDVTEWAPLYKAGLRLDQALFLSREKKGDAWGAFVLGISAFWTYTDLKNYDSQFENHHLNLSVQFGAGMPTFGR